MVRADHPTSIALANDPAIMAERREIVHMLKAQGMAAYAIYRFIRDSPDLVHLIEGMGAPYAAIQRDLEHPPRSLRRRQTVTDGDIREAADELARRYDALYSEYWEVFRLRKEHDLLDSVTLQYLQEASKIAAAKASMRGVQSEPARVPDPEGRGPSVNIFAGPQGFLQGVEMARQAVDGDYFSKRQARPIIDLPSSASDSDSDEVSG